MLKKSFYELIDHAADFGIHVFGSSTTALFQNAAMALIDQLVDSSGLPPGRKNG